MDLNTVEEVSTPASRAELGQLTDTDAILAGGTWLFSEPNTDIRRLVDLTALGWKPITLDDNGIEFAATCPIAEVGRLSTYLAETRTDWAAAPLFYQCCTALLASPKIWRTATIGGNICLSFPAGSMISLTTALDGVLLIWRAIGGDYRIPVSEFVTGSAHNVLDVGDVVRSVHVPASALRARTAYRKLAPSPLGRSAVVVIGRRDRADDGGGFTLSISAATKRPCVFRFPSVPNADEIAAVHADIPDDAWEDDAHGDPDWRCAVTLVLARQVCDELS
jgi:CO/xanthine dehydrogenase FAD-binding subunit